MEGKTLKPNAAMLIMALLVLGMFVEPATAKFRVGCYAKCMLFCYLRFKPVPLCAAGCLVKCIYPSNSINDINHHYCETGCASSKCINISTPKDPRAEEVGICVDSCSDACTPANKH